MSTGGKRTPGWSAALWREEGTRSAQRFSRSSWALSHGGAPKRAPCPSVRNAQETGGAGVWVAEALNLGGKHA